MVSSAFTIVAVDGLAATDRRGVVFLACEGDDGLNASVVFSALPEKRRREVLTRFDYWIAGKVWDKYFHGWPGDVQRRYCFVFKWKAGRVCHRLYGFLCNPQPRTRPRFQLCVLVSHATKTTWETDPRELDGSARLREDPAVKLAVAASFPDSDRSTKRWLH